ncbi:MAG TPA: site-2 protease family protein [Thermoplasmata archaeon]|nr:site-2 protease family protein [Thermoplasmata archaeon]
MASGDRPRSASGPSELERIRSAVAARFPVYETRLAPQSLLLAVHIDPTTLEPRFDALRRELGAQGYIPFLRREMGEEFIEVVRRPRIQPRGTWLNAALLAATLATTVFAGALIWMVYVGGAGLTETDVLDGGLFFGVPLMTILGLHELAHYWVARRRHLDASLPFFLPVPPPLPFGTFGAFVSIRDPFPDRKAMFDVSAGGPVAGFLASIPVSIGGLYLSAHAPVVAANYCAPTILGLNYGHELFSPSALWSLFGLFFPTSAGAVHPLAIAGWVGILVTSINLLPIGSLDGGRVFRALLGDRAKYVSYAAAFALFGLSVFYLGWFVFGLLVIFLGLRNPPPLNDVSPIGTRRYLLGGVVAAILVAGFVVVPIQLPPGSIGLEPHPVGLPAPPPGAAFAANLTATVENRDPIAHAFLFELRVTNVTTDTNGTLRYLTPAQLAAWGATSNWTFYLPDGRVIPVAPGADGELPAPDYLAIAAHDSASVTVEFSNPQAASAVVVEWSALESCPPSGGGTAAVEFAFSPI